MWTRKGTKQHIVQHLYGLDLLWFWFWINDCTVEKTQLTVDYILLTAQLLLRFCNEFLLDWPKHCTSTIFYDIIFLDTNEYGAINILKVIYHRTRWMIFLAAIVCFWQGGTIDCIIVYDILVFRVVPLMQYQQRSNWNV